LRDAWYCRLGKRKRGGQATVERLEENRRTRSTDTDCGAPGEDYSAAKAIFSNGFIVVSRAVRLLGPFIT